MKLLNIALFSLSLAISISSYAQNDVLNFYNEITKKCSEGKNNFLEDLIKLDEKIKSDAQALSAEKLESLFREENLSSDIYSYLGTDLLSEESELRGLKACGKHYAQFIKKTSEKLNKESAEEFEFWKSCLESDYKEVIPEVAKKIINCYDSRLPSQAKPRKNNENY